MKKNLHVAARAYSSKQSAVLKRRLLAKGALRGRRKGGGSQRHIVSIISVSAVVLFLLSACAPKPNPDLQIQLAVAQTVAAIPTTTPYPTPRIPPTGTPANLSGLFCEYQFCIGHPVAIAFFDLDAQRNPQAPSSVTQGMLVAYGPSLYIQVIWQDATGTNDASFMLDTIMDSRVDSRSGDLKASQINGINIDYVPIKSVLTPTLPYGGAAAWLCGGRAFAWKAYTPQANLAISLFNEALQKFRCNP